MSQFHKYIIIAFTFLYSGFYACKPESDEKTTHTDTSEIYLEENRVMSTSPLAQLRWKKIKQVLETEMPVLRLDSLSPEAKAAEELALNFAPIRSIFKEKETGSPMLNEIFNIRKASYGELGKRTNPEGCYRVELYNYALNTTWILFADISASKIIKADSYRLMQPDLNPALSALATDIAINAPATAKALGFKPGETDAIMSATKTALNRTKCERSMHLCAAPTFIKGDKALWAIVDLTEMTLVGLRWTNVGNSGPSEPVTERQMRLEKVMKCNCRTPIHIKKGDWELDYALTGSDGLEISRVKFKGKPVLKSAKLVDFHVVYSNTDGFGYSDAIGCPAFSAAAVVAQEQAKVKEMSNSQGKGFALEQIFVSEQWPTPCNYSYLQRFEFYENGSFRIGTGSLGRGCGSDGTYRPVTRIVFEGDQQEFKQFKNGNWSTWDKEQWALQNDLTEYYQNQFCYQLKTSASTSYLMAPGNGQFEHNRGDFAYTYVTLHHPNLDEGDADLPTIGPCCNTNHEQGPEKFIGNKPEKINGSPLVLWYVSQLKNDGRKGNEYCWAESYLENGIYKTRTWPCISGPFFTPIQKP